MKIIKEIDVKKHPSYDGHEKVFYFEDKNVNLRGFVAWHNTKLGPATGGTRLYPYTSDEEALDDVLRLSKAMSSKCAIADIPFGGGKAVIIGDKNFKNENFLKSYAEVINSFDGKYTTGTDMGISDKDTLYMSKITPYILKGNGKNRTTSKVAAYGIYLGIKEALRIVLPEKKNLTIGIKGIGKIGSELVDLFKKDEIDLVVADIDKKIIEKIKNKYPDIEIVTPAEIHKKEVDVYCPCALGKEFNKENTKELNCKIIAGGANNQLVDDSIAQEIKERGICYIPDYLINSGGLIHIVDELDKTGYNKQRVEKRLLNIVKMIRLLLEESKGTKKDTLSISKEIVNKKLYDN
ncbi:MAG: Glu/Leu/Phe/Val dehydrogenase dimerization domain-containing protein [Patescibacteria group bacterium]|nr:Glu/Leu/Phe/Val dehydrogenase dimerization domain-containing protein [Patescibacteria group bacterium]